MDAFAEVAKKGNTLILPSNMADMGGLIASAMTVIETARKKPEA